MHIALELGNIHFALVDFDDYEALADLPWHARPLRNNKEIRAARYVTVNRKRRLSYLHNEIMQPRRLFIELVLSTIALANLGVRHGEPKNSSGLLWSVRHIGRPTHANNALPCSQRMR